MAITDAKKRKIGRILTDWIHLGIRTGARRSVADYRTLVATDPVEAKKFLVHAINAPRKARARINAWIASYDAANGAGTGQVYLQECLTLAGSVTLADLNADLTVLENAAQTLFDNNAINGWTLDQVATAIEGQFAWEAKDWEFPIVGYTDIDLVG